MELEASNTVEFLDWGQDFLEWDIKDGRVIGCRPFQEWFWEGTAVHNQVIQLGSFLSITCSKGNPKQVKSYLKYPLIKITELKK